MAIINHSNKFIFIHVPKAAGTSITKLLSDFTTYKDLEIGGTQFGEMIQPAYYKRFGISKHSTAKTIENLVGKDVWQNYLTFSFVRNPYDRVVSTFYFLRSWAGCPDNLQRKLKSFDNINQYIQSTFWNETNGPDDIFLPQSHWVTNEEGRIMLSSWHKTENIDHEMINIVSQITGMKGVSVKVPAINKSARPEKSTDLSIESVKLINDRYKEDFTNFEYEMLA